MLIVKLMQTSSMTYILKVYLILLVISMHQKITVLHTMYKIKKAESLKRYDVLA